MTVQLLYHETIYLFAYYIYIILSQQCNYSKTRFNNFDEENVLLFSVN